jgi:CheY-like chemotaxis protein
MLLQFAGHETPTVHSDPAAADARSFRSGYVFRDIGLPGMNGYEVATRLRGDRAGANVVLIALTGWGSEEDRRRSKDAGFDFHLTKPVDADAIDGVLARFSPGARRPPPLVPDRGIRPDGQGCGPRTVSRHCVGLA